MATILGPPPALGDEGLVPRLDERGAGLDGGSEAWTVPGAEGGAMDPWASTGLADGIDA